MARLLQARKVPDLVFFLERVHCDAYSLSRSHFAAASASKSGTIDPISSLMTFLRLSGTAVVCADGDLSEITFTSIFCRRVIVY